MGAVTALYYMHNRKDLDVVGLILDSPFGDLEQLAVELYDKKSSIPNFMVSWGLSIIDMGVKSKAEIEITEVSSIKLSPSPKLS